MKVKAFIIFLGMALLFSHVLVTGLWGEAQQTLKPKPRLMLKRLPDLRVSFTCPSVITAGSDIGSQVKLKVWNAGQAPAAGTEKAGQNGYMVDLMLSTNTTTPAGWATYSATFHEDVLLKGGRISVTQTLAPGQSKMYPVGGGIPANTPPGVYYICAKVDAGNKIGESNEGNNVYCARVKIQTGNPKRLPDLQVKFNCPTTIVAGSDIGSQINLKVWNSGAAPAAGTSSADSNGYMVDVMLSTDTTTPAGWATYSAAFHEDVLLKGGRISVTQTLAPGQSKVYPVGGGIPADAPAGGCYICAKVDSGNKISEQNEGNNVYCRRVYIKKGAGSTDDRPNKRKPDLIISKLNFSPGKPTIKDEITFWVFVKNIGPVKSGPSKLRFQVGGETRPPIVPVPALKPGQEYRYTRKVHLKISRTYRTTATADFGNNVPESNETNNVKFRDFRVTR